MDDFLQRAAPARPARVEHRLASAYRLGPQEFSPWCVHDRWVLECIDADGMRTRVRGIDQPFDRPPGRWHLYAAGTAYSESYRRPDRIREEMWFFFQLDGVIAPLTDRPFAAIADPEGRLAGYCRSMYAIQQRGERDGAIALHGLFWAALGEVLMATRHGGDGDARDPWTVRSQYGSDAEFADRVDALVMTRLARPPSLGELSRALHVSPSSLSHRFKQETGMTLIGRIRWLRMREARRLLGQGHAVKNVARTLGFSAANWFARVFREVTGETPAQYQTRFRVDQR